MGTHHLFILSEDHPVGKIEKKGHNGLEYGDGDIVLVRSEDEFCLAVFYGHKGQRKKKTRADLIHPKVGKQI